MGLPKRDTDGFYPGAVTVMRSVSKRLRISRFVSSLRYFHPSSDSGHIGSFPLAIALLYADGAGLPGSKTNSRHFLLESRSSPTIVTECCGNCKNMGERLVWMMIRWMLLLNSCCRDEAKYCSTESNRTLYAYFPANMSPLHGMLRLSSSA